MPNQPIVRIGYINDQTYPPYYYNCSGSCAERPGIAYEVLNFLCQVARVTPEWVALDGSVMEWERMQYLVDGKLDVLAELKTINYARFQNVSFTFPLTTVHRGFITGYHEGHIGKSHHEIEFSKALKPVVWYCFFGACLLISFMATMSALVAYWNEEKGGIVQALARGTWFTSTTTFTHSYRLRAQNPLVYKYLNFLFHFWSTLIFLMQGLYSNLITSSLLVPQQVNLEYHNLSELAPHLKNKQYKLILSTDNLFSQRNITDVELREVLEENLEIIEGNIKRGMELLESENIVMYGGEWTLAMLETQRREVDKSIYCKYSHVHDTGVPISWKAFPVRKGFPYTRKFSETIYNCPQVINYLMQRYNKSACKLPRKKKPPPVALINVKSFFLNFQYAVYAAFAVLAFEFVRHGIDQNWAGDWKRSNVFGRQRGAAPSEDVSSADQVDKAVKVE